LVIWGSQIEELPEGRLDVLMVVAEVWAVDRVLVVVVCAGVGVYVLFRSRFAALEVERKELASL